MPECVDTNYALSDEVVCQVNLKINGCLLDQTVQRLKKCLVRVIHSYFEWLMHPAWLGVLSFYLDNLFHVRSQAFVELDLNLMLPRSENSVFDPLIGHLVVRECLGDVQFSYTIKLHSRLNRLGQVCDCVVLNLESLHKLNIFNN